MGVRRPPLRADSWPSRSGGRLSSSEDREIAMYIDRWGDGQNPGNRLFQRAGGLSDPGSWGPRRPEAKLAPQLACEAGDELPPVTPLESRAGLGRPLRS